MGVIAFWQHIRGPDWGGETDPDGLTDFAGHSLKGVAQEIPLVTVPHLYLSVW